MSKYFKPLTTSIHLYTAAANKTPIAVFIEKERIGSGAITKITETSVKIKDEYFMRSNCSFWIETTQ